MTFPIRQSHSDQYENRSAQFSSFIWTKWCHVFIFVRPPQTFRPFMSWPLCIINRLGCSCRYVQKNYLTGNIPTPELGKLSLLKASEVRSSHKINAAAFDDLCCTWFEVLRSHKVSFEPRGFTHNMFHNKIWIITNSCSRLHDQAAHVNP